MLNESFLLTQYVMSSVTRFEFQALGTTFERWLTEFTKPSKPPVQQSEWPAPSYRWRQRPQHRRDIREPTGRVSARDQETSPDVSTQTAARPATELRAGERNS